MRFSEEYSYYELDTLPGCSQVVVSHSMFIPQEYRGKGQATDLAARRLGRMIGLGYDLAICTVDMSNDRQLNVIKNVGWKPLITFESSKTGHTVGLFANRLTLPKTWYDYENGKAVWER